MRHGNLILKDYIQHKRTPYLGTARRSTQHSVHCCSSGVPFAHRRLVVELVEVEAECEEAQVLAAGVEDVKQALEQCVVIVANFLDALAD